MARFTKVEELNVGDVVWVQGKTFEVVAMAYGPDFGARNDAGFLVALEAQRLTMADIDLPNKLANISLGAVMVVNEPMN